MHCNQSVQEHAYQYRYMHIRTTLFASPKLDQAFARSGMKKIKMINLLTNKLTCLYKELGGKLLSSHSIIVLKLYEMGGPVRVGCSYVQQI